MSLSFRFHKCVDKVKEFPPPPLLLKLYLCALNIQLKVFLVWVLNKYPQKENCWNFQKNRNFWKFGISLWKYEESYCVLQTEHISKTNILHLSDFSVELKAAYKALLTRVNKHFSNLMTFHITFYLFFFLSLLGGSPPEKN